LEVGIVDPRREEVPFTTGVASSPDRIVPPNGVEGIAELGLEGREGITLD
jgi:hypothetical protein